MIRMTARSRLRGGLWAVLALGACLAGPANVTRAQDTEIVSKETLEDATGGIAADLAKSLKSHSQSEVVLGRIELTGVENTVALPLAKSLEAQKIKIVPEASAAGKWRISGEAGAEKLPDGTVHVVIECKLRPPLGLAARKIVRYAVTSPEDIRKMSGITGTIPVGTQEDQSKKLPEDLENPKFNAEKRDKAPDAKDTVKIAASPSAASVFSAVGTPQYKIEVLVQRGSVGDYLPLPPLVAEGQPQEGVIGGQPIVDLKPGDNYAIRVVNGSNLGAGVEIAIDGINLFNFCDNKDWKKEGKIYFKPGQAYTISGWYFPGNETRKFKVVNEEDSLHQKLGRPRSSVGVITVRFCAAWGPSEEPPADEKQFSRGGKGTAVGERDPDSRGFREAEGPKIFGVPRAQVSVRYSRPDDLPPDLPP